MVVQKWKPIEEKVRPVTKSSNSPLLRQAHTHDPLSLSLVKQLQDTGELDYWEGQWQDGWSLSPENTCFESY